MDDATRLKFSSYVLLLSVNKFFSILLRLSDSGQSRRGNYFGAWVPYVSFGTREDVNIKHISHVLLACIKVIYKYDHAWVI